MRHAGFARNFESTLRLLAERGHEVHVCFDGPFLHAGDAARPGIVERLAAEEPSVSFGPAPDRTGEILIRGAGMTDGYAGGIDLNRSPAAGSSPATAAVSTARVACS